MRILTLAAAPVDNNPAVLLTAKLAANLWANVDLLAVEQAENGTGGHPQAATIDALLRARQLFLDLIGSDGPYSLPGLREEAVPVKPGHFEIKPVIEEGRKELRLRIRMGEPGREIVHEAFEDSADLVIMNAPSSGPKQLEEKQASLKVAAEAPCSTLIIKEIGAVENMIVAVENPRLSQTAREMMTQIATIFHTPAAMYALHSKNGSPDSEEMNKLMKLFRVHDINVVTEDVIKNDTTIQELFGTTAKNMLILR